MLRGVAAWYYGGGAVARPYIDDVVVASHSVCSISWLPLAQASDGVGRLLFCRRVLRAAGGGGGRDDQSRMELAGDVGADGLVKITVALP